MLRRFLPGPGPGAADGVGGGDNKTVRIDGIRLAMMLTDRGHDLGSHALTFQDIGANKGVGSFNLLIHGFADIVKQSRGFGHFHIGIVEDRHKTQYEQALKNPFFHCIRKLPTYFVALVHIDIVCSESEIVTGKLIFFSISYENLVESCLYFADEPVLL